MERVKRKILAEHRSLSKTRKKITDFAVRPKPYYGKPVKKTLESYRWIHPKWDIFRILYPESPSGPFLLI